MFVSYFSFLASELSVLRNPEFDHHFTLHTYFSGTGLDTIYSQNFDGKEVNRKLTLAKWRSGAMEST